MEKMPYEVFKMWVSNPRLMEVKDPFLENHRMKREMLYNQYKANLESEVPPWMSEKMFMAIKREGIKSNKKSFITKIVNWFKI